MKDGLRTNWTASYWQGSKRRTSSPPACGQINFASSALFRPDRMPPNIGQIEAFVGDDSPDAYAKVVDECLLLPVSASVGASRLDVAATPIRPEAGNPFPNAYRFREYVIDSYNEDKPFDQFAREQIAGDLLPPPPMRNTTET